MNNRLSRHHSAAVAVYWLCGLLLLALAGSVWRQVGQLCAVGVVAALFLPRKRLVWAALTTLPFVLLTPLLNHNGTNVWFFIGYTPITWDAVVLGVQFAASMASLCLWMLLLAAWVDTSTLLLSLRRVAPRLALMLQMTLRTLPLLGKRAARTRETVKMRMPAATTRRQTLRAGAVGLQAWTMWNMEAGMDMAVQLKARGYGATRTTVYHAAKWRADDSLLLGAALLLTVAALLLDGWYGGAAGCLLALSAPVFFRRRQEEVPL